MKTKINAGVKRGKRAVRCGVMGALFFCFLPQSSSALVPDELVVAQWSIQDTHAIQAWDATDTIAPHRKVVVAIIDNGFDSFHPYLNQDIWRNLKEIPDNGIDDDHNGYVDDTTGWNFVAGTNDPRPSVLDSTAKDENDKTYQSIHHGTLVAGIIDAIANHGGGRQQILLMNLKVAETVGTGNTEAVVEAIHYAVENGADIINMSLVGTADPAVKDAVRYAYERGVVVVAAAGNDKANLNADPSYPVCADAGEKESWVLGVSAINQQHYLARFSNQGASCIDLTAPGVNIASVMRYAPAYGLTDIYGGRWSGTSFSTPFVSSVAALIKIIAPTWTPAQIYQAILATVHKTPASDPIAYKESYGAGLLDAGAAVAYALARRPADVSPPPPPVIALSRRLVEVAGQEKIGGKMASLTIGGESQSVAPALSATEGIAASFFDQGQHWLVTLTAKPKNKTAISLYDGQGKKRSTWLSAPPTGSRAKIDWQVSVGDVTGDSTKEIILASRGPSQEVWRVYSLAGKELQRKTITKRHTGVALGLATNSATDKKEILALFADAKSRAIHRYDSAGKLVSQVPVSDIQHIGQVAAGDLAGNGQEQYVVAAGPGDAPTIWYYNQNGDLLRRFNAYDSRYRGGLQLVIGDYDRDGKEDVIVALERGRASVRVWSSTVHIIGEWWPFGENRASQLTRLIGLYEKE